MENTNYHNNESVGRLEVVVPTMDGNIGVYALSASTGPRGRSINTCKFLGLEQTWGPMPQNTIVRASSESICGALTGKRVQLRAPRPILERPKDKKTSHKQALLIASLNIRGK